MHEIRITASVGLGLALAAVCHVAAPAKGQERTPEAPRPPDFKLIRYHEDYRYLAMVRRPLTTRERLKYVPLDPSGFAWVSFGGELRERWAYQRNPDFGAEYGRSSVWLQRGALSADLHVGPVRFYGQLLHAIQEGRPGGPSPVDENRLDVQNAFLEIARGPVGTVTPTARLGRQEMRFGSGRLVDPREGPNVRRTFDGGRLIVESGPWMLNGLYVRPREDGLGVFDDRTNDAQALFGGYATAKDVPFHGGSLDLYVLGYENHEARFVQGRASERRTSVRARISGKVGSWDYNWEVVGQLGQFGGSEIRAWTLATETG